MNHRQLKKVDTGGQISEIRVKSTFMDMKIFEIYVNTTAIDSV